MSLKYDLNLLVVLHVLLEERSVTRTGERLGRTQSAISNSLKRLRETLGDPLLIRSSEGLVPTPRAIELAPAIARIVEDASTCYTYEEAFDPSIAKIHFTIGVPDRLNIPVILPLLERLRRIAAGVVINVRTTDRDYAIRLVEEEQVNLSIGWIDETPPHIASEFVFEDRFVCLCRNDHPLLEKGPNPSLSEILNYSHLVVSSTGDRKAAFDATLQRNQLTRSVGATLMSFTLVPELLMQSDMIGVFTNRTSEYLAERHQLSKVSVPLQVAPIANHMIWHRRFERDPAHSWLRRQIIEVSSAGSSDGN